MGRSFYYEFAAPAAALADDLESFVLEVEGLAQSLGFAPTMVFNGPFDSAERRHFSTRLGGSLLVQDERLKTTAIPAQGQLRDHDPVAGECRVFPVQGVVIVITDETGCESAFGFMRFPERVVDINGAILAETKLDGGWWFRDFVSSPDPRYGKIVERFQAAGYWLRTRDEWR